MPTRTTELSQRYNNLKADMDALIGLLPTTAKPGIGPEDLKGMEAAKNLAEEEAQRGNVEYQQLVELVTNANKILANADLSDSTQVEVIQKALDGIFDYFDAANGMIEVPLDANANKHIAVLKTLIETLLKHTFPGDTMNKDDYGMLSYESLRNWLTGVGIHLPGHTPGSTAHLHPKLHTPSSMRQKLAEVHEQLDVRQNLFERRRWITGVLGATVGSYVLGRWMAPVTVVEKNPVTNSVAPDEHDAINKLFEALKVEQVKGRKLKISFPTGLEEGTNIILQVANGPGKKFESVEVGTDGLLDIPNTVAVKGKLYFSMFVRTKSGEWYDGGENGKIQELEVKPESDIK